MNTETLNRLTETRDRVKALGLPGRTADGQPLAARIIQMCEDRMGLSPERERENKKAFEDLAEQALRGKNVRAIAQLNRLIVEETQNYLLPRLKWGRFFSTRILADNESFGIQNNTQQEVLFTLGGQDSGHADFQQVFRPENRVLINPSILKSRKVKWRLQDINTGEVASASKAMFNIARDLELALDAKMHPVSGFLANAFGNFDFTNANHAARTRHPHSGVVVSNLPSSNELSTTVISTNATFGFHVIDEAVDYALRWADVEDFDGSVNYTLNGNIHVPVTEIREITASITKTGARATEIAENAQKRGWASIGEYLGQNWNIIPSNSLPTKQCYFEFSQQVGILLLKPNMDKAVTEEDVIDNEATSQQNKYYALAMPLPNKPNILRVRYKPA